MANPEMLKIYNSSFLDTYVASLLPLVRYKPITFDLFNEDDLVNSYEIEWYETPDFIDSGAVGTGGWIDATTTTALPVSAELAQVLAPNMVLKVEDELVVVKSIDAVNNKIDVYERGFAGSTATAHTEGTPIYIVGKAEVEGQLTDDYSPLSKIRKYNYTQEFTTNVILSRRAIRQSFKSYEDLLQEEQIKAIDYQLKMLNRTAIYGRRFKRTSGAAAGATYTGSLEYFITGADGSNPGVIEDASASGGLSKTLLDNFLAKLEERNSDVDVILVNPVVRNKLKDLANYQDFAQITDPNRNGRIGLNIVGVLTGTGKELQVITDPEIKTTDMFFISTRDIYKQYLNDDGASFLRFIDETNTNSNVIKQTLRTEVVFRVERADRMGIIRNV